MEKSELQPIVYSDSAKLAKEAKKLVLKMVNRAHSSHIGCYLSIADVLAVLFHDILKVNPANPEDSDRDYLIISKASSAIYYVFLALKGFFPIRSLDDFYKGGSIFSGHVNSMVPGIEFGTGSMGHCLPVACGNALALKMQGKSNRVYCVVGDGEMQEGSNWEAILFAAQHSLSNFTLVIDCNKLQATGYVASILNLENFEGKLQSFGWETIRVDGHDHKRLSRALHTQHSGAKPLAIICDTVKGKGVSFMENNVKWHYCSPSDEELAIALKEIESQ